MKKANVSKVGGSRFEILSEDMDVTISENLGQSNLSSVGGSKAKGKGILVEITNQKEVQSVRYSKNNYDLESRV